MPAIPSGLIGRALALGLVGAAVGVGWATISSLRQGVHWRYLWATLGPDCYALRGWNLNLVLYPRRNPPGFLCAGRHLQIRWWKWGLELRPMHVALMDDVHGDLPRIHPEMGVRGPAMAAGGGGDTKASPLGSHTHKSLESHSGQGLK